MAKHGETTRLCKASFSERSPTKHLGVIASPTALSLAVGFFAVTMFVLFADVAHGASITTDHVLSFAVLVGTFASGHLLTEQLRQWRLLPALGLLVLFCAGTFYVVTSSAGRNAAATGARAELVHQSNDNRARIEADLKVAKDRLTEAQDKEADECASGKKLRCEGRMATRQERQAYVDILEARLRLMDPAKSEYPELRHAAKVFASIGGNEQAILDRLILWLPFLKALFAEVATLVFGSIAFRPHSQRLVPAQTSLGSHSRTETVPGKPSLETVSRRKPSLGFLGKPGKPLTKTEALADLLSIIEGSSSLPSQSGLQSRFGVESKGTVSKWLAEWEAEGRIVRIQSGRMKRIARSH